MADVHNLIWNDKLDELQALVPTHVHINQGFDGKTMLHEAVLRRNTRIVEWLVRQPGIQIDAVDRYGASPFMCAARLLSVDMMRVLHHHGASTDTADRWGLNAFHEVARAATKRDLDTFYACITLMRTCVPLCVTTEAWTYVMSVANPDDATPEIKRAFHLLGQYIHDEMTLLVQAWCPIRVLADLIMQYWLEDYSIFNP
jgi:ankyrin repeat protein